MEDETKRHLSILRLEIPKDIHGMQKVVEALAESLANGCVNNGIPLAEVALGFVSEEGMLGEVCADMSKKMGINESKLGLAFLGSFGRQLFVAELSLLRDKSVADGMEIPSFDWLKEHSDEVSFVRACFEMEELTCDCPACILVWFAKKFAMQTEPQEAVDEVIEVIKKRVERGNEGCVRNKYTNVAHWKRMDGDPNN